MKGDMETEQWTILAFLIIAIAVLAAILIILGKLEASPKGGCEGIWFYIKGLLGNAPGSVGC